MAEIMRLWTCPTCRIVGKCIDRSGTGKFMDAMYQMHSRFSPDCPSDRAFIMDDYITTGVLVLPLHQYASREPFPCRRCGKDWIVEPQILPVNICPDCAEAERQKYLGDPENGSPDISLKQDWSTRERRT